MRAGVVILCVLGGCFPIGSGDDWQPAVCGDGRKDLDGQEQCDDGNTDDGDGCSAECWFENTIDATWTIQQYDGTVVGCPAGFDVAELATGTPTIADFPCTDGHGSLRLMNGDRPALPRLSLVSTDRTSTYSNTRPPRGTQRGADGHEAVDYIVYTDAGYFHVSWTYCTYPAQMILTATSKTSSFTMAWVETCAFREATEILPFGDYTFTVTGDGRIGSLDGTVTSRTETAEVGDIQLHAQRPVSQATNELKILTPR